LTCTTFCKKIPTRKKWITLGITICHIKMDE
jgi:hypothetical protein